MKKLITTLAAIAIVVATYSQITPVTGLETFAGKYKTGIVHFSWITYTETNNKLFRIRDNGKEIAIILSHAFMGNSALALPYKYDWDPIKRTGQEAGLPGFIVLLSPAKMRKPSPLKSKRRVILPAIAGLLFALCLFASCKKDGTVVAQAGVHVYSMEQEDLDGTIHYADHDIRLVF